MKEIITKIKYFSPWNLKKEEDYLNKMNQNGYEFIKRCFFIYKFKKVNKPNGTFKIDYRQFSRDGQGYLNYYKFLKELEVINITDSNGRHYFKILKDNNLDFFSDKHSQIQLLKRILKDYSLGLVFTLLILSTFLYPFPTFNLDNWDFFLVWGIFIVFYLVCIFNILKNYIKLKKETY